MKHILPERSEPVAFLFRCGYVASKRSVAGSWIVIYIAAEQDLDVDGKKYAVVCEAHGSIAGESSVNSARMSMKAPENFCDGCRR